MSSKKSKKAETVEDEKVNREQVLRTETQDLPVKLDAAARERVACRMAAIPQEMAQAAQEFDAHSKAFKTAKADHDSKVATLIAEQAQLATAYRDGVEIKPVRVDIVADFQTGTICPLRQDTEEWIEHKRRAMTDDERQLELLPQKDHDDDGSALDKALDDDDPLVEEDAPSLGVEVDGEGNFEYNDEKDEAGDDLVVPPKADPSEPEVE